MTRLEFICSDEKAVALIRASRLYDEGVEPAEWIRVTDSLPDEDTPVLCVDQMERVSVLELQSDSIHGKTWVDEYDHFINLDWVTHWMSLPKTPNMGE